MNDYLAKAAIVEGKLKLPLHGFVPRMVRNIRVKSPKLRSFLSASAIIHVGLMALIEIQIVTCTQTRDGSRQKPPNATRKLPKNKQSGRHELHYTVSSVAELEL